MKHDLRVLLASLALAVALFSLAGPAAAQDEGGGTPTGPSAVQEVGNGSLAAPTVVPEAGDGTLTDPAAIQEGGNGTSTDPVAAQDGGDGAQADPTAAQQAGDGVMLFLFVQSASSMEYRDGELLLEGVPNTLFFTDRPRRLAGHMLNSRFAGIWSKVDLEDPPNAALSILGEEGDPKGAMVVELLGPPEVNKQSLLYKVRVVEGEPPRRAGSCGLFIDAFPTAVNSQVTD